MLPTTDHPPSTCTNSHPAQPPNLAALGPDPTAGAPQIGDPQARLRLAHELALALFRDPAGAEHSLPRLVALGLNGPAEVTPAVLKYSTYTARRAHHPATPANEPTGTTTGPTGDLVAVLARRLHEAERVLPPLHDDHDTATAVAALAAEAPDQLAELMATRLATQDHQFDRWPSDWTRALLELPPPARAPFAAALRSRTETARAIVPPDEIDAFEIDQILARISDGTPGWDHTLLTWASGGPGERGRAAAAVAATWWLPTWPAVVSRLLQAGLESEQRQALLQGIDLTAQGPDIADHAQRRLRILNSLGPQDHPAIVAFRDEASARINTELSNYQRDANRRRRGYR